MVKKSNSQIKSAIPKYKSDYGIIISNTEKNIFSEMIISYISLQKCFHYYNIFILASALTGWYNSALSNEQKTL